jgi:hypothetical protein
MVRVIEHQNTLGVVALAAVVIVLYSLWGASLLNAQRQSPYSAANSQAQVARN